jgi:hypothetical protein
LLEDFKSSAALQAHEDWYRATERHIRAQQIDAKNWFLDTQRDLGILLVYYAAPFNRYWGTQHLHCTFELPGFQQLREGVNVGYENAILGIHKVKIKVEIAALEEHSKPPRLQLLLHGCIPGTMPSRKRKKNCDAGALQDLEQRVYVVLASVLLWRGGMKAC